MSDKDINTEDYPVLDTDDESSGMDLVNKDTETKSNAKPGELRYFPFKDWLKQANSFSGKHNFKFKDNGEQVDEASVFPQGSSFGGRRTGMAKKSSFMQPGQGKQTIGSEGSMKDAGSINPLEALDIKAVKEQLGTKMLSKLEQVADIINIDVDEIIQGAISGSSKKNIPVTDMINQLVNMYI